MFYFVSRAAFVTFFAYIWSFELCPVHTRIPHNELFLKLFLWSLGKQSPHTTSFSTSVEKLVVEEYYDARTYGQIVLHATEFYGKKWP